MNDQGRGPGRVVGGEATTPAFTVDSRWVRRAARSRPRQRLVCLPFAGGGASIFHSLPALLPGSIEVIALQLPGREDRAREGPPADVGAVAEACAAALRPYLRLPYALYGHCAGALLALEVAYTIWRRGGPLPTRLLVGAQPAPHLPTAETPLHQLPDDELLCKIAARGGIPDAIAQRPAMLEMLLPLLRSDFALWETYRFRPRDPLPCPVTAVCGHDDELVSSAAARAWEQHTTGGCTELLVEGGHYFISQLGAADGESLARVLLGTTTATGTTEEAR